MNDLREQLKAALHEADCGCGDGAGGGKDGYYEGLLDAIMPVVDRLTEENTRLAAKVAELDGTVDDFTKQMIDNGVRAEQAEDLLRIAHETSNESERVRQAAVQRADRLGQENTRLAAELATVRGYAPDPDEAEDLRDRVECEVAERLGGPCEPITDALMVFATREVARAAGDEMTARWRVEAQLAAAKKKIEELSSSLAHVLQIAIDEAASPGPALERIAALVGELALPAISSPTEDPVWLCIRCGSSRWVAASLTGPVDYGGRAIKQCVSCGYYSNDPVTKINPPPGDTP